MDSKQQSHLADLVARRLSGQLSAVEESELDSLLANHPELRDRYQALLSRQDLVARYRAYSETKIPLERMAASEMPAEASVAETSHGFLKSRRLLFRAGLAVAAMLVVTWVLWPTSMPLANGELAETLSALTENDADSASESTSQTISTVAKAASGSVVASAEQAIDTALLTLPEQDLLTAEGMVVKRHNKDFWLTLDDGTRVHLSYNSQITYPVHFPAAGAREVQLSGAAYFAVAPDADRPFVVHTAQGEVRDYGTEFDVATLGGKTQVVLLSGKVGVAPSSQDAETLLKPEQMAVWSPSQPVKLTTVDTTPYRAWNADRFTFDECTLDDLMMVVGRWYGFRVRYARQELRHQRFSGIISRRDDVQATLRAIATIADLHLSTQGQELLIDK